MCETVPGQIIVSYPRDDGAAHQVHEELTAPDSPYRWVDEVSRRKKWMGTTDEIPDPPHYYHLFEVAEGFEEEAVVDVYHRYAERLRSSPPPEPSTIEDRRLIVAPNPLMGLTGRTRSRSGPAFGLTEFHTRYLKWLGENQAYGGPPEPPAPPGRPVRVVVLDSGIDADAATAALCETQDDGQCTVARHYDFTRDSEGAIDELGHGSVVAALITSVAPQAELYDAKVIDGNNYCNAFDVMSALVGSAAADVVNLSLRVGLDDRFSLRCPFKAGHTLSTVVGRLVDSMVRPERRPILVAAAGNEGRPQLAYPARFAPTVAVSSITSGFARSGFSNYGMTDHTGGRHAGRYSFFGGNEDPNPEPVARGADGKPWCGTSMAAAYASGIIALGLRRHARDAVLAHLHTTKYLPGYADGSESAFGQGVLRTWD